MLSNAKRTLNPLGNMNSDFQRKIKSPLPSKKTLPLINSDLPRNNHTIMAEQRGRGSRNNSRVQNNTNGYKIEGVRVPSRNREGFSTINVPMNKTNLVGKFNYQGDGGIDDLRTKPLKLKAQKNPKLKPIKYVSSIIDHKKKFKTEKKRVELIKKRDSRRSKKEEVDDELNQPLFYKIEASVERSKDSK